MRIANHFGCIIKSWVRKKETETERKKLEDLMSQIVGFFNFFLPNSISKHLKVSFGNTNPITLLLFTIDWTKLFTDLIRTIHQKTIPKPTTRLTTTSLTIQLNTKISY